MPTGENNRFPGASKKGWGVWTIRPLSQEELKKDV